MRSLQGNPTCPECSHIFTDVEQKKVMEGSNWLVKSGGVRGLSDIVITHLFVEEQTGHINAQYRKRIKVEGGGHPESRRGREVNNIQVNSLCQIF